MALAVRFALGAAFMVLPTLSMAQDVVQPTVGLAAADGNNLIVYRARAEPTAWSTAIKVDGRKIVGLPNRHYTSARLAPGKHIITVDWPLIAGQEDGSIEILVDGSETHFVEITGTYRYAGPGPYLNTMSFRVASGIAEVTPAHAGQVLQSCCKFKPSK